MLFVFGGRQCHAICGWWLGVSCYLWLGIWSVVILVVGGRECRAICVWG